MFKARRKRNGNLGYRTNHWRGGARRRSSHRRTMLRVEPLERRQLLDAGMAGELLEATTPPDLEWLTYVGGVEDDWIKDVAVDGEGNYLICGQDRASDGDAFISKVSPSGEGWTYYFPAIAANECEALAVDDEGNIFATGTTFGAGKNTWVEGGFDSRTEGMPLAFIIKLNAAGEHKWSSLTGDPRGYVSWGNDITVDSNGDVFIVGWHGPSNSNKGSTDGFVRKISDSDIDGDEVGDPRLVWSHSIGGDGYEDIQSIALDSSEEHLILAGDTDDGAVVMKLVNNGDDHVLRWSHYLGAELVGPTINVAVDGGDNVLVAGGAPGPNGTNDALVAKLSPTTGDPLWTTFLGGAQDENCLGLAVDADGNALVTGRTWSAGWVSADAFDSDLGGESDAFVAQISPAGEHIWSSYLGGSNHENINGGGIAYDPAGYAVVVGDTGSEDLWDGSTLNGSQDGFVAKIRVGEPAPPAPGITVTPTTGLVTDESGKTDSFTVVLDTEPAADVTIGLSTTKPDEGTVAISALTFTPANWSVPQTVVVTGVDDGGELDGDAAYSIVLAPASSSDANYDGLDPLDVSVTNLDNDAPPATPIYVWDIRFETQGVFTSIVVDVRQDSDPYGADINYAPAVGINVEVDLYDSQGNYLDTLKGTTDSDGIFRSESFKKLADGTRAEVLDLALTDFIWDPFLDLQEDGDENGLPDEVFAA